MPLGYTKFHSDWKNFPDTSTPLEADALDAIEEGIAQSYDINNFLQKGATVGQAVVWDGSKWAPASVTAQMGTALPGSPTDGDQFILVDSTSAPTYSWLLKYVAAKASNKWIFIGGAPIYSEVQNSGTFETTASTTYVALATAGPSIVVPVAGDYIVEIGFNGGTNTTTAIAFMSYDIGGTGAVDADALLVTTASNSIHNGNMRAKKKSLTAVTLTAKYKASTQTVQYTERWMRLTPVAIGG